jgi:hypothetical protein
LIRPGVHASQLPSIVFRGSFASWPFMQRIRRCNLSFWLARRQAVFEESARANSTVRCLRPLARRVARFRKKACLTGRENTLEVLDDSPSPHSSPRSRTDRESPEHRPIAIIRAIVENLLKKLEETAMKAKRRKADKPLVAQMDRLRKKIGPIGVPVAELVREGRRQQSPPLNVTRMVAPPI